jgi:hypothetical protein
MHDAARPYRLDSRHVPFTIEPLPHALLWSAARGNDPEIAWLRDRLRPLVKAVFATAPVGVTRFKSPQHSLK